ncbi:hypothetical protein IA54_013435 [Xanthomonas phaseoli pv. syngonii LMG 9055]|uniref:Uncharacterized protein n=1 Tax=Xanthomonas phaseoli pv. syngonii LMG 9055 TaxID=1437878 RepID=A0A1V9GSN3_9XANT|nr:hypothetical protein IA54_013435 [Xanthomonas phaseoli pv. syngonii LMG 9055]
MRAQLAAARTELVEERQRREHAEADTLRATGAWARWNSYWHNCGHRTPLANPKTPSQPVQCR